MTPTGATHVKQLIEETNQERLALAQSFRSSSERSSLMTVRDMKMARMEIVRLQEYHRSLELTLQKHQASGRKI
ncbi:MAG: hypothetical protein FJX35_27150 [Alphaproteobacteria bacterium]|nr:hypothetical protein [Alphaproteobacteria bacterium]